VLRKPPFLGAAFYLFGFKKKNEKQKFEIASGQSKIEWVGRKVTGLHNGTIAIKKVT
jgi:hypothetical protein